tara:strand:+ start:714 stop:935 length:222 start_codon:yes stop_codon:yes gene_type:complete
MNNLKKVNVEVAVGDKFTFRGENEFFTRGRKYIIETVDFDNGTCETSVEVVDDEMDRQLLGEKFFTKNFIKTV